MSAGIRSENCEHQTEHAWRTHAYLNEYIMFADAKAGVVMAIAGALCVSVLQSRRFVDPLECGWLSLVAVFMLGLSFASSLLVITPLLLTKETIGSPWRTFLQSVGLVETPRGLIFWKSIKAHKKPTEYIESLKRQDSQGLLDAVANHTYELSKLAQRKYGHLSRACVLLVLGITAVVIFFGLNQWDLSMRSAESASTAKL